MNHILGYFAEVRSSLNKFEKYVDLAALTGYANLTLALWQHSEKIADAAPDLHAKRRWADDAAARYQQMIEALKRLQADLEETGLLKKS
jgi:hypothetical protein